MTNDEILALQIHSDDTTIKQYLHRLLSTLWEEEEGFSGKRPFGDSGWTYEIYLPLCHAGLITYEIDKYGDIGDFDAEAGYKLVDGLIDHIFREHG